MAEPLSSEDVRHVARLARLRLDDDQIERYRLELSSVLEHIAKIAKIDVKGVEPLSHPIELSNRLDEDEIAAALPIERLLELAPAVEDRYLAVPKVLPD